MCEVLFFSISSPTNLPYLFHSSAAALFPSPLSLFFSPHMSSCRASESPLSTVILCQVCVCVYVCVCTPGMCLLVYLRVCVRDSMKS